MAHSPQFLKLVQDAKKHVKETNVADVKRRRDAGEKFLLVDVREDNEWANGHLPDAVHLSKGIIERDIEQRVPDTGAKVILYCGGGFRSALAADSDSRGNPCASNVTALNSRRNKSGSCRVDPSRCVVAVCTCASSQ